MEVVSNEMSTDEAKDMTPEQMKEIQTKIEESRADFDKRNTINGMTVHFFSAMLNGMYSTGRGEVTNYGLVFDKARSIAEMAFTSNQEYLDNGAAQFDQGEL